MSSATSPPPSSAGPRGGLRHRLRPQALRHRARRNLLPAQPPAPRRLRQDGRRTPRRRAPHSDDPGEFQNHPRWQRVIITLAGPIANFILSIVLMTGLFMVHHETEDYVDPARRRRLRLTRQPHRPHRHPGRRPHRPLSTQHRKPHLGRRRQSRSCMDAQPTAHPSPSCTTASASTPRLALDFKGRTGDFDPTRDPRPRPHDADHAPSGRRIASTRTCPPEPPAFNLATSSPPSTASTSTPSSPCSPTSPTRPASPSCSLSVERPAANGGPAQNLTMHITPVFADPKRQDLADRLLTRTRPHPGRQPVLAQAFAESVTTSTPRSSKLIFEVLHRLFTREVSVKSLSSPIGIGVRCTRPSDARLDPSSAPWP